MKLVMIGHGMVGHKFIEAILEKADDKLEITILAEEPRIAVLTQSPTITAWSTTAVSLSSSRRRRERETVSKSWLSRSTHPVRAKKKS